MKNIIAAIFLLLHITACNNKTKPLPINTMKMVMWDMISADEWTKISASKDSSVLFSKKNVSLYNKVFADYNISKEQFYSSYSFYQNHPNQLKELMDSLMSYGTKKRDTVLNHLQPATKNNKK